MNVSQHALERMVERGITPGMVRQVIKYSTVRYKAHKDSDKIAFERDGIRVVVDPHTRTLVTAMWIH